MKKPIALFIGIICLILLAQYKLHAQCQLLDYQGNASSNPLYIGCSLVFANDSDYVQGIYPAQDITGNWTMIWGDGDTSTGTGLLTGDSIFHTYKPFTSGGAVIDTFSFTFIAGACTTMGTIINGFPVDAVIEPLNGIRFTCAPGTYRFVNSSNNASGLPTTLTTVYTIDFGDGTTQVFDYTSTNDTIYHQYQRGTVQNCDTRIELEADHYCNFVPTFSEIRPLLVWDIDGAAINASATTLCYPDTVVTVSNGSVFNCLPQNNFPRGERWNLGQYWGNTPDSLVGFRPAEPRTPLDIAFPGRGTYNISMIDTNFCGWDTAFITINIIDPPLAGMTASDDTICAGESVTFTNTTTAGADQFAWDFGDGGGFNNTGGGPQTHTYNTAGVFTVRLATGIAGADCQDTTSIVVVVLNSPNAQIAIDTGSGCDSVNVIFSDSSTFLGSLVSWNWDFGNGNTSNAQHPGNQFFDTVGVYNVSLTVVNNLNCPNTDIQPINVYMTPIPDFTPQNVCANELTQFQDQSLTAAGDPVITWLWDFGDGSPTSTVQNPTHIYTTAGTYTVTLNVATANCSASDTLSVVVEQLPTADFNMDVTSGCSPLTVNFTNASSVNAFSYFWDFGDGDTASAVDTSHTFTNNFSVDTTFQIMMVAQTQFGCLDTVIKSVTVFPNPDADFDDNAMGLLCTPESVGFTNLSANGAVSYLWTFGDGDSSTATNPTHIFVNNNLFVQSYTVTLIAYSANGCTDTITDDYQIFPQPDELPTVIDSGCEPLTFVFPPVTGAVSYFWTYNNGASNSNQQPDTFIYNNPGTDTVTLLAVSVAGCTTNTKGAVIVYPKPSPSFFTQTPLGCSPLAVTFENNTQNADTYYWDFDDGDTAITTDTITNHLFNNQSDSIGIYNVVLGAENSFGCVGYDTSQIIVYPLVVASFNHEDSIGCSPFEVSFNNTSSASATRFFWDFGDGTTSQQDNPIKVYLNTGIDPISRIITLTAASDSSCGDSDTSEVTIYPTPIANFDVQPSSQSITYPDTVFGIQNNDLRWRAQWDFGDSSAISFDSIPGSHAYTGWGEFTITQIAYNEYCSDTAQKLVTINPPLPIADFGDPAEGCEDLEVQFFSRSRYAHSYRWTFIHSTTNAVQKEIDENPVMTFVDPGTYNVSLTVEGDGGTDEETKFGYITVYEQPEAEFTFAPEQVIVPTQKVVCFNNSKGDDLSYVWDFGDGSPTTSQENPDHLYTAEGEYTITLIASNGFCDDTTFSETPVIAVPSGEITAPNAFTPNTQSDPSNYGEGGYDWTVDGEIGTSNDVFYPVVEGNFTDYEFMVFNKWGELLFRTDRKTVGWTGWYRNRLCQQDVYVYKVNATKIDNSEVVLVGDLTLLR